MVRERDPIFYRIFLRVSLTGELAYMGTSRS